MISLSEAFPNIAAQWDYELNGNLTPDIVSYGSNKVVWWRCPICGQPYQKKIANRTAPAKRRTESEKCPVCLGRVIIPGFNSLKAKFPEIIANEWDFKKNDIDPDNIPPTYRRKVWWLCSNGHSYDALSGNKIYNNGGNCPYCSSQRLCSETSLLAQNPLLARSWHPTKNQSLTPADVFANSNKFAWWICPTCGHEWKAKISNRNIGMRGCPRCAMSRSSSVPEQLLFKFIKRYFPDTVSRHKINRDEIDVYIPSAKIGIEYDGQQYHNEEKLPKDISKSLRLIKRGVILYRFREEKCPSLELPGCHTIKVKYSPDYKDLENKLKQFFSRVLSIQADIKFEEEINEVRASLDNLPYEDSFAYSEFQKRMQGLNPRAIWDIEENYPLTPEMVMPFSDKVVQWICPNNPSHKWRNTVKSVSRGYGCRRCSTRRIYTTEEWIQDAQKIHGNKYDYHLVHYINSDTKVDIICPKHGAFPQLPYEHLNGKGCPYCAHQKFHQTESLASLYPSIAAEWDYDLNDSTGFTPETIGIDTRKKFYWRCNHGCNHSYLATIAFRVKRNSGCAICHGKQVSRDTSLAALNPSLAAEWCEENDKLPTEVTLKSDYEALWKCPNPNHPPYRQKVEVRSRGIGCVYCSRWGKKHPKDFEDEVHSKFPYIEIISTFTKMSDKVTCKCSVCGHIWSPNGNNLIKGKGCPKCRGKQ